MNKLNRTFAVLSFSFAFLAGSSFSLAAAPLAQEYPPQAYPAQGPEYPAPYTGGLRALVDRTQADLRAAEEQERQKQDQRDRYQHAQGHLSTFDRHLMRGRFDKGELDKSIDSIKSVLDKNVLTPPSRDALVHDLAGLREARDHRY
jgi:hypothetical protein